MKLGNLNGRAVLAVEGGVVDIEQASAGRLGPNISSILESWAEFRAMADDLTGGEVSHFSEEDLTCPVPHPRQVFAIGLNYLKHAEETGNEVPRVPAAFTKFPASLSGPFDNIAISTPKVDWEIELVVVMGQDADRVSADDAWEYVAGLTVGQDISDRQLQMAAGRQFSLGKSRRGFGPMGPWIVTPDEFDDPDDLELGCSVDGEIRQQARTSDLAFPISALIEELSGILPLLAGDIIFTGTPSGVGLGRDPQVFLQVGETLESWVEGIGTMRNRIVAE